LICTITHVAYVTGIGSASDYGTVKYKVTSCSYKCTFWV